MNAHDVIEAYINDTARLLPRKHRADVARELRSLLSEELANRSAQADTPPNAAMATQLVRQYGHPAQVASRYQRPWVIIDPSETTAFVRAALVGTGAIVLLAAFAARHPAPTVQPDDLLKFGILGWLGVLVIYFGIRSAMAQRTASPPTLGTTGGDAAPPWQPVDRDRVSRWGVAVCAPLAAFSIAIYAAPRWMVQTLTGGRIDAPWAVYTDEFTRARLPIFLATLIVMLGMLLYSAFRGRTSRALRRWSIGVNLFAACMVLLFAVDGNILQSPVSDRGVRDVLALFGVVYLPCVCAMLYAEIGRLEKPATHTA